MKVLFIRFEAAVLIISVILASFGCGSGGSSNNAAQSSDSGAPAPGNAEPSPDETTQTVKLTEDELDQLLAPIALYPDPLLAQMMPAATFVDQIVEAQRTLDGRSDDSLIANQDWDVSVKSIAHYPPALKFMADDVDWTTTLGQAYINQPDDISRSIQRLRLDASNAGNLVSTPQQEVIEKDNFIMIEPAEPKVIYVPQYNPETVYVEQAEEDDDDGISTGTAVAIGALAFGAGLLIGSWLNRDYDYYGYYGPPGIYYHGWGYGPGPRWVGVNRGYVDVDINRNIYINDNYRNINVNRNVFNRTVAHYRTDLSRNAVGRKQRVTNARVNRQLDKQRGVGPRDAARLDVRDRDRGRELNQRDVARNRDRKATRSASDRKRTKNVAGGDRSRGGDRNNSRTNKQRSPSGGRSVERNRTPQRSPQPRQRSAPRRGRR